MCEEAAPDLLLEFLAFVELNGAEGTFPHWVIRLALDRGLVTRGADGTLTLTNSGKKSRGADNDPGPPPTTFNP